MAKEREVAGTRHAAPVAGVEVAGFCVRLVGLACLTGNGRAALSAAEDAGQQVGRGAPYALGECDVATLKADALAGCPGGLVYQGRERSREGQPVPAWDAAGVARVADQVLERVGRPEFGGRAAVVEVRRPDKRRGATVQFMGEGLEGVGAARVLAEDQLDDRRTLGVGLDPRTGDAPARQNFFTAEVARGDRADELAPCDLCRQGVAYAAGGLLAFTLIAGALDRGDVLIVFVRGVNGASAGGCEKLRAVLREGVKEGLLVADVARDAGQVVGDLYSQTKA